MSYSLSDKPCVSILVLSEDSAKTASDTLGQLAKKAARLVDKQCQTQCIVPEPASENSKAILAGNLWKSSQPKHRQQRVTLVQSIATKIKEPDGYVLFHIDGDRAWAKKSTSENVDKFDKLIRRPVKEYLRTKLAGDKADELIKRLVLWVPFYSIEAWLYQNTGVAIPLCKEHHRGTDVAKFETWRKDRGLLDELTGTKLKSCLGSDFNLELTQGFPTKEVYEVGKSFSEAVDSFRDCSELMKSLSATHQ